MAELPLDGITVVDFGTGRSAALLARLLIDLGCRVNRFEPEAGDPFRAVHPAYAAWQDGKTVNHARDIAGALKLAATRLADADVCLVGGDDYPGLDWRPDVAALARDYPDLIIVAVDSGVRGMPAHDLLVQAHLGIVFEQHSDRPAVMALPVSAYGAALEAALGLAGTLCARERGARGQIVRTSLSDGAMTWLRQAWFAFADPPAEHTGQTPKGVHPLIFQCADDAYIHFVLGAINARRDVFTILGIDNPVPSLDEDPHGLPSARRGARDFLGDIDLIQAHVARWRRADLITALAAKGVAVEAVNAPGEGWTDAQVGHNRLLVSHKDGSTRIGLPFVTSIRPGVGPAPALRALPNDNADPPLAGIRVLDFGSYTAGPHASMLLADLGADVIKVEGLQGDPMRGFFQILAGSNRGKRSIAIDLKTSRGQDLALRLCATADMMQHNLRPGVTARLGLDEAAVRAINPGIILLENAGYGLTGPEAARGGFDMIFQACCGHEILAAGNGNPPENYILPTIDMAAGMLGAIAGAVALFQRLRTGWSSHVETSLLNAGLYLLSDLVRDGAGWFAPLPMLDCDQLGFHPAERLYAARDGWIAVVAADATMAARLVVALGLATSISRARADWGAAEATAIAAVIAKSDLANILDRLARADVWACACNPDGRRDTLADDARLETGSTVSTHDHRFGQVRFLGRLFALSRSRSAPRGAVPALGNATRDLLAELGYDDEAVASLYRDGVVA